MVGIECEGKESLVVWSSGLDSTLSPKSNPTPARIDPPAATDLPRNHREGGVVKPSDASADENEPEDERSR